MNVLAKIVKKKAKVDFTTFWRYLLPLVFYFYCTGWLLKNGPPFYIGFQLILIVLGNSDEQMPYWLGLGDSFAVLYIAVTCALGSGIMLENVKILYFKIYTN